MKFDGQFWEVAVTSNCEKKKKKGKQKERKKKEREKN